MSLACKKLNDFILIYEKITKKKCSAFGFILKTKEIVSFIALIGR